MRQLIVNVSLVIVMIIIFTNCRSFNTNDEQAIESITITIAGYPVHRLAYQNLAQQFQETHPHIEIQYVSLDEQTIRLDPRQTASLADVLLLTGRPPASAPGAFLSLEPLIAAEHSFDANDFWPGLLAACQANGVQVGLPLYANASLIVFDKSAFDAVGLPYPEPGWNWDTFQHAVQTTSQQEGEQIMRYGFLDSGQPLLLLAPFVDSITTRFGYEPNRLTTELDWYVALSNEGTIPLLTSDVAETTQTLIKNRQAAMWISSQSELTQWQKLLGEDLGVAPLPASDPVVHSNVVSPGCVAVSSGTTQVEAAWSWAYFLTRQLPAELKTRQVAPARMSTTQSSIYWHEMDESVAAAIRHALEHGWYSRDLMPELMVVREALIRTLAGQGTLAKNLPDTVAAQNVTPVLPDNTPIVVATPYSTDSASTPGVITVDYLAHSFFHGNQEAVTVLAQTFNESQDRVKVNIFTAGPYRPNEAADAYDCFAQGGNASSLTIDKFYSLSPLFDAEDAFFQNDFEPSQLENNQVDGQLYALPVARRPFVVQYNADLLVELGLDIPSPDWTVDDFWTIAVAAARDDDDQKIYGFAPNQLFPENLLLFVPGASPFYDLSSYPTPPLFAEPSVIQSLTWLASMVEAGVMYPIEPLGTQAGSSINHQPRVEEVIAIEEGRVAMWIELAGNRNYSFRVGEAPYPLTELELLSGQAQPMTILLISRRAANPSGCWEWLKFLSAQPAAFQGLPIRRSILESTEWLSVVGDEAAAAYQAMAVRPSLILSRDPTILEQSRLTFLYNFWWADALRHTFAGSTPATALEEVQRRADAYLTCIMTLDEGVSDLDQSMACAREADPEFQR